MKIVLPILLFFPLLSIVIFSAQEKESMTWWQVEMTITVSGDYFYRDSHGICNGNYSFTTQVLGSMEEDEDDYIFMEVYEKIKDISWKEKIAGEDKSYEEDLSQKVKPKTALKYALKNNDRLAFNFEFEPMWIPINIQKNIEFKKKLPLPKSAGDPLVESNTYYNNKITSGSNLLQLKVEDIYNKKEINKVFRWNWQNKKKSKQWQNGHEVEFALKIVRLEKDHH